MKLFEAVAHSERQNKGLILVRRQAFWRQGWIRIDVQATIEKLGGVIIDPKDIISNVPITKADMIANDWVFYHEATMIKDPIEYRC